MADTTRRFGLTVLNSPTDQLNTANYKFSDGDRTLLDHLLRVAVEAHTHTGASISVVAPGAARLVAHPTGGSLPPNATAYYRYSIVDARGQETIASATASVNTPVPASAPGYAPRISAGSGYMEAGVYLYACSACTFDSSQETPVGPTASATLADYGGWYLDLPPLPTGAHFFNIYRKGPRETELKYLVTMNPADRSFVDTGQVHTNQFRNAPVANTTYRTNSIEVNLPGPFPLGSWTWKLFRTFDPANWDNSLLDWMPNTSVYTDDGRATRPGYPPSTSSAVGGAPKINIVTETQGTPPPAITNGVTRVVNLNADIVRLGPGAWRWLCEYERAEIQTIRASVNRSNPPWQAACSIGVDLGHMDDPDNWTPVNVSSTSNPLITTIGIGQTVGIPSPLDSRPSSGWMTPGSMLRLHVYQTGYAPTEINHDLTLTVTLRVHDGLSSQTYQWETT
jgi:hypothetical protein